MNINNFSGHVYYDKELYVFIFDNYTIQLIPGNPENLIVKKANYFSEWFDCPPKDGFIDDTIIYGRCFDGKNVAFCISDYPNGEFKYSVKWLYIYYNNSENQIIRGISFTSQEINYFYDTKKYVTDDYELEKDGFKTFTVNVKSLERTNLGTFNYDKYKFDIYGNMAFKKNYDVSNNLELWSKLELESDDKIDNLDIIYKIVLKEGIGKFFVLFSNKENLIDEWVCAINYFIQKKEN